MSLRDELHLGAPPADYLAFLALRTARAAPDGVGPVSRVLRARLTAADLGAVEAALDPGVAELWRAADEPGRARLLPAAVLLSGVEAAAEHARLTRALPPAATRGDAAARAAAVADAHGADVVVEALVDAGRAPTGEPVLAELDCGHGERLRLLAAVVPGATCLGTDHDPAAVRWVSEQLAPARALPAPGPAELPFDAAAVDVAYGLRALHALAAADAVRLLAELGRVVRPGGSVVLAVRGWAAMGADVAAGAVVGGRTTSLLRGMYRTGHHVLDEDDAPRAYMTLEWLMTAVQELFALERHLPSRLPAGEDVVVLARR